MFGIFRKTRAAKRGIPFYLERYWPPFYISFANGERIAPGVTSLTDIYDFGFGDVAPVFRSATETHFYRIVGTSRAAGDDHIVSPRKFDIEYHHSEPFAEKSP